MHLTASNIPLPSLFITKYLVYYRKLSKFYRSIWIIFVFIRMQFYGSFSVSAFNFGSWCGLIENIEYQYIKHSLSERSENHRNRLSSLPLSQTFPDRIDPMLWLRMLNLKILKSLSTAALLRHTKPTRTHFASLTNQKAN